MPSVVRAGQGTWLNCSYDPGDDVIYSLKWYKDNVEILGYMPLDEPGRLKIYNLTGVYIDVSMIPQGKHFILCENYSITLNIQNK